MTTLRYEALSLTAGKVPVLEAVDLEVSGPGTFVLLGPSGVGKSSLLRATQRLIEHGDDGWRRSGDILLNGRSIFERQVRKQELARRIGFIPQRPRALGGSVLANVEFALRHTTRLSRREVRDRAEAALEQVGLVDELPSLGEAAAKLSGGQIQRLAIARAVALDPEAMLVDEPSSALDPMSAERVEDVLLDLARNRLVVLVTHKVALAMRLADSAAFLLRGPRGARLADQGKAPGIFQDVRDPVAREFLRMGQGKPAAGSRKTGSRKTGSRKTGSRQAVLRQLFLFICGGNTSRSPMAQAICRAEVAQLLGISQEELEERGVRVVSAGLSTQPDRPMTERARGVLGELGFRPHDHATTEVTEDLVHQAGEIYCMTEAQCRLLAERFPAARGKVTRLDPVSDIEDPSPRSDEIFVETGKRIRDAVRWRLASSMSPPALNIEYDHA